jgi:hypothetical protein
MPRPQSSALARACRTLAASLKADMAKPNADPELWGRPKDLWAADLNQKANGLIVAITSLGLFKEPNGERVRATHAYHAAREKWEFLTEKKWTEE